MHAKCEISRREADEDSYFLDSSDISGVQPEMLLIGGTCCKGPWYSAGESALQVKPSFVQAGSLRLNL
jgi:hypothetical protein